ncbi:PREDICTED: putative U-box domain-containing protein 42 [Nelumbo nucifera]|uniref:RING-type E3 ubiquitin transferase n=2 Tax=Nelumbo nucifera TaxID=4432 RepID=A0A1U8A4X3_NELNU|nr:PREDICTED: putative U-box domain-containing protein 42 [Nelumbo nucifera]DAD35142.1 TPA_asm: hypothetical protein HUJ06_005782 [Nelumbo nucifera]
MSLVEDTSPIVVLGQTLLATISEITASVVCVEIEQENFMEVGCYLDRTSPAIIELQFSENKPLNAIEILQTLTKSINHAKDLMEKCRTKGHSILDAEVKSIIEQLEGVIKDIGEGLSLIPSSMFKEQEYAEVAIRSLSQEMQNVHFKVSPTEASDTKDAVQVQSLSEEIQNVKFENSQTEVPETKETIHVQPLKQLPEEEHTAIETDLYSINAEFFTDDLQSIDMLHLTGSPKGMKFIDQVSLRNSSNQYLKTLPQVAEYIEPLYEAFICPLTQKIMDDPVTIENGVTYERRAITEWFKKFEDSSGVICPTTGKKLSTRDLNTNVALKTTIEEWKERNEAARIKVARAALSLASSDNMILEALKDLQDLCQQKKQNKVQARNMGMLSLLAHILEYKDRKVRCATLDTLRLLVKEDDEGKDIIEQTKAIPTTIKMLSSNYLPEKHASLLFLLELSRCKSLCEKIGSVTGCILMLITMKYNYSYDPFAAEKADEILQNLETSSKNVMCMAENGLLEPLLHHLIEGTEEMQMEMARCLGEIVLARQIRTHVAERASPPLIKMVHSGNSLTRKAALKALVQISSYSPNRRILVNAGTVPIMIEEIFKRTIDNEPMDAKEESVAILANILESDQAPEDLQVSTQGRTMASDHVVYKIIQMLKSSSQDEVKFNLIRILLCLTNAPKATVTIVSVVKETEVSYNLIELINSPHEKLGIASIKLLITLSPYIGHTLSERLCKTRGQPESLIKKPTEINQITEKHAVSANFLARLPRQNLTLNLALLHKNTVPTILETINEIQITGSRASRFAISYLEGLVGILVRFTTTLYESQVLLLAKSHNLASVFTELLIRTESDEIQKLSAIGLENLSSESINLSRPPQLKKSNSKITRLLSFHSSKERSTQICPVHRGACSSQTTFCLLDNKAVERLLACLDHENVEVVEAALSALCTLLDDKVDVDKSVSLLNEMNLIQHLLNVMGEHRKESVQQKSFWLVERFLVRDGGRSVSVLSQDRFLPSILVSAFHGGDVNTRQMAEKILRHLNKMPNFSTPKF